MKQKVCFILLCILISVFVFSMTAFAAETLAPGSTAAYFVDNTNGKDTNSGTNASAPLKTLSKANTYLREIGGGTIVISGDVKITSSYAPADIGGAVTYTSVWNNIDYRQTNGAKLSIGTNIAFNNDTYFKNIDLAITASSLIFSGRCNNFGFLEGVKVTNASASETFVYPTLIGGWNAPGTLEGSSNASDYSMHIYSGTWESVSAGHRRTSAAQPMSSLRGDIALVIKGGTFNNNVFGTGMNIHTNRFYMSISGGTFNAAVCPIKRLGTISSDTDCSVHDFSANVLVEISGGTFNGRFRLAESAVSTTGVTYPPKGDATVVVTGGTFNSDFVGYGVIGSVLLKYKESVLSADKIKGFPIFKTGSQAMSSTPTEEARFTNPLGDKPDPYVIEKDGIYYYCFSSGETIDGTAYPAVKIAAHGSVAFGELTTQLRSVFNASETTIANAKKEYWAPELHYFDAATVGSANAGWYIYVAADNGSNANHRMYVLRATDPENPLSDYEMIGQITDSTNKWAIDGTVLVHGGKLYFVWSGWAGDTNVAQNIYIAQMSNPWTISSSRVLLSTPEYSWETQGSPDVNEGPQVLKAPDGTVHIVYSASGSWDQYYCYGVLTLTGSNPLNASHWYKATSAKFSSGNGMYGTGHGSFVQDDVGDWWMIYHANPSLSVPSGSSWWAERNTYAKKFTFTTATLNGVSVKYPSFGTPAAHGSTQYIDVRTADYHASGDHFYSPLTKVTSGTTISLVKTCYICGSTSTLHTVDAPKVSAVKNNDGKITLTITPTLSGATGYIIYRAKSENGTYTELGTTTSKTYTDTDAELGATYYYKVKQYKSNAYGTDATYGRLVSTASSASAGIPVGPAAVPVSLYYDGEKVNLKWSKNDDAVKYRIFKRIAGSGDWGDAVIMSTDLTYNDTDITANTTYEYAVQAWAAVGDGYCYSALIVNTISTTQPAAPKLSLSVNNGEIVLTATEVSGATGYKFYSSADGVEFTQIDKTTSPSCTTHAPSTPLGYYRARAYTQSGSVVNYGILSNVVTYDNFPYVETDSGLIYTAIADRAKNADFTVYEKQLDYGTAIPLATVPSGSYFYAVYGDFMVDECELSSEDNGTYTFTVPYEAPDAIVFSAVPLVTYGDVSGDGKISIIDVIRIIKYSVSQNTDMEFDIAASDINKDIKINIHDVLECISLILNVK